MRKAVRVIMASLLALVFLFSAGIFVYQRLQLKENVLALNEAQELVDLPEPAVPLSDPPPVPAKEPEVTTEPRPEPNPEPVFTDSHAEGLLELDLSELQTENEDVIGWIEIPDTPISYPLLQGEDNQYYLNRNWKGEYNPGGSIFMETQNQPDLSNFNTIIYGHRMSDSSMFNSLRHYESEEYLAQHPRVYIVTAQGVRVYEVFAAMKVTVTDPVYWLITNQQKYMQKMIDFCVEHSVVSGSLTPTIEHRFLTLSTCTSLTVSNDRWVVVAAEIGIIE